MDHDKIRLYFGGRSLVFTYNDLRIILQDFQKKKNCSFDRKYIAIHIRINITPSRQKILHVRLKYIWEHITTTEYYYG